MSAPIEYIPISKLAVQIATLRESFSETANDSYKPLPVVWNKTAYKKEADRLGLGINIAQWLAFTSALENAGGQPPELEFISSRPFETLAQQRIQSSGQIFEENEHAAYCINMKKSGKFGSAAFIMLSPALSDLFERTELDYSALFQAQHSVAILSHIQDIAPEKLTPAGPTIPATELARTTRDRLLTEVNEGMLYWLDDYSLAVVRCDIGLNLKAELYPNDSRIIKEFCLLDLAEHQARVYNSVREDGHFAMLIDRQHKKRDKQFMLISYAAAQHLDLDIEGYIDGIKPARAYQRSFITDAFFKYNGNGSAEVLLGDHIHSSMQRGAKMPNKGICPLKSTLINNALRRTPTPHRNLLVQGEQFQAAADPDSFSPIGNRLPMYFNEDAMVTATFSQDGAPTAVKIEFTSKPPRSQLVATRAEKLTIQCGGRQFTLEAS